jgi:UDP-glucose-4-epimerase GalE
MKKILVTGGAGYVGSHCVKNLVDAGYDCIVYDNLSTGHRDFVKWTPLIVGDIRDKEKLNKTFTKHNFDAVIHFAAHAYVGESVINPMMYWDNNFVGTKTLLECMLNVNVKKIVFSSTCAVYGQPDIVPITEDTARAPINPYGHTKLACENLMDHLNDSDQLKSIRFRYFNAAGSSFEDGIGEWHDPETHLLPLIIESAIGKSSPINVFGVDFPTKDGSAIRDYIHVKDLAVAHLMGLEYLLYGGETQVLNLGSGKGTSVIEVINAVERAVSKKIEYSLTSRRAGDPAELVADPARAYTILGWKAKLGMGEIISDALKWHLLSKNLNA